MKVFAHYQELDPKVPETGSWDGNPLIEGFAVNFSWDTLDREGWEVIQEKTLGLAKRKNKKVVLSLIAGRCCPEWVMRDLDEVFEYDDETDDKGNPIRMPLPWDEKYLSLWEAMVQRMADRFRENDLLDTIAAIKVTGSGEWDAMSLPNKPSDIGRWTEHGFQEHLLIGAWKRLIGSYRKAFPETKLLLLIDEPLGVGSDCMQRVVDEAVTQGCTVGFDRLRPVLSDWTFPETHSFRDVLRWCAFEKKVATAYFTSVDDPWYNKESTRFEAHLLAIVNTALSDSVRMLVMDHRIFERDANDKEMERILKVLNDERYHVAGSK